MTKTMVAAVAQRRVAFNPHGEYRSGVLRGAISRSSQSLENLGLNRVRAVEVRLAEEHSGKEQRRVDGRELD